MNRVRAKGAVARRREVLRRVVVGFVLIAAIVAMHNVAASTLPGHTEGGSHHWVSATESPDDAPCSHHSHGSNSCDWVGGIHACEAILLDPEPNTAASPLAGWVEPSEANQGIHTATDCGASLRGPPTRTAPSQAELSIWRL